LDAIDALLGRQYWTRVWVQQEMGVAPKLQFVCGRKGLSDLQYFYALSFLSFYQLLCASDETKKVTAFENRLACENSLPNLRYVSLKCRIFKSACIQAGKES
jgi:hypothetical protein